jgi:EAL domain-containing protein (putative c-di-GMP-specific phosphodiesterase class I)
MVPAAELIAIAENCGLMLPLGEWVLRAAVRQLRLWQRAGLPPLRVRVNLSAVEFRQAGLVDLVGRILAQEELPSRFLGLEISERVAMDQAAAARRTLRVLCAPLRAARRSDPRAPDTIRKIWPILTAALCRLAC